MGEEQDARAGIGAAGVPRHHVESRRVWPANRGGGDAAVEERRKGAAPLLCRRRIAALGDMYAQVDQSRKQGPAGSVDGRGARGHLDRPARGANAPPFDHHCSRERLVARSVDDAHADNGPGARRRLCAERDPSGERQRSNDSDRAERDHGRHSNGPSRRASGSSSVSFLPPSSFELRTSTSYFVIHHSSPHRVSRARR